MATSLAANAKAAHPAVAPITMRVFMVHAEQAKANAASAKCALLPHWNGFVLLDRKAKPLTDADGGAPLDVNVFQ